MSRDPAVAVLTGDIVGSRKMSAGDLAAVRAAIDAGAGAVAGWRAGLLLGGPEHFRGDGWQLVLGAPGLALRAAIAIRAQVRALPGRADTRVAIGIGAAAGLGAGVGRATGEAFVRSGEALDAMKRGRHMALALAAQPVWLGAYAAMLDTLVSGWTARQALVAQMRLVPGAPTQAAVAQRLGQTQQAIVRIERGARLAVLGEALEAWEAWQAIDRGSEAP